jgi:hypothetical protein
LRRVRYKKPPEGRLPWLRAEKNGTPLGRTGQKCVSSPVADDVESLPAHGRKTEAPRPAVETRRCDGCDADFRPPAQQTGMLPSAARVDSKLSHRQTKGRET